MTKLTLPILILIMLVISPLFFSVTELNGDDERVLISDLQIFQQVDCITTPNINCKIDRVVYENFTYRDIFGNNLTELDTWNPSRDTQITLQDNLLIVNTSKELFFGGITKDIHTTLLNKPTYFNVKYELLDFSGASWFQFHNSAAPGSNISNAIFFRVTPIDFNNDINVISGIRTLTSDNTNVSMGYRNGDEVASWILYRSHLNILPQFNQIPTQQQLDQWFEYYLEHKDQGIINDFYHIQSDTLINMSHQAYNGIDNLIVRTNNFIDWLTLDVASLLSRSIGFLGDKTYEILDDVGIISNDFTWWADFNDSLPTWLKRLVGLE